MILIAVYNRELAFAAGRFAEVYAASAASLLCQCAIVVSLGENNTYAYPEFPEQSVRSFYR